MFLGPSRLQIWTRRCFIGLGIVLAVCVLGAGYLFLNLTSEVSIPDSPAIKDAITSETLRKLKLFEDARKIGRKGYIHLSQAEVNAYLEQHLYTGAAPDSTNSLPTRCQLQKSRIFLTPSGFIWVCWVRVNWGNWGRDLVWQRVFDLVRAANHWDIQLQAMQVGRLNVPPRYWPHFSKYLGSVDSQFSEKQQWLANVPAVEIRTNNFLKLEFKLYNYPDPGVLNEAKR